MIFSRSSKAGDDTIVDGRDAAHVKNDNLFDCIERLALSIARTAPVCAEKAMQIVGRVDDLRGQPDHISVLDTLELGILDTDTSDSKLRVMSSVMAAALKNRPG